jgi:radical SAM superfamily enzyme YgiQ (UPF0313 family)
MAKIIFLTPPGGYFAERWSKKELIPALGIGYIASVLEQCGHAVKIIDPNAEELSIKDIIKKIKNYEPNLVGITFTTENRFEAFKVAKIIKKKIPFVKIALGGPHVWRTADDTLKNLNFIDYIVRGEGELTTMELLEAIEKGKDLKNVKGLSFRSPNGIIHNPDRELIENLNEMPFPARHLYPMEKYNYYINDPNKGKRKTLNLMTSRGCPFNCNFCATPSNWGRKVRYINVERIMQEIKELVNKYKAEALWFYDDTFTFNPQRVHDLCDEIIAKKLDLSWYCEIRIDTVSRDLLKKMKDAGCFYVGMGIESASQRILNEVINKGKAFSLDKVTTVIKDCLDFGIIPNPFFIISHPTETYHEARKTMDYIKKLKNISDKIDISISIMHIYPGTPLEALAKERGLLPPNFSWSKKKQKGVITLPAAQGEVPLFIDKLTWRDISRLLFEWSQYKTNYSILNKIPKILKSIRSWNDFVRYLIMMIEFTKIKCKKLNN